MTHAELSSVHAALHSRVESLSGHLANSKRFLDHGSEHEQELRAANHQRMTVRLTHARAALKKIADKL